MNLKRIVILGAGFCGLAVAYYLTDLLGEQVELTIMDAQQLGENASGISAGLLHAYPGVQAKRAKNSAEGMEETLQLAQAASRALGQEIAIKTGLLRPAISAEQRIDFFNTSQHCPDTLWMESQECEQRVPNLADAPGLYIADAYMIKTKEYLQGLWKICESRGISWQKKQIDSLDDLSDFDLRIICGGASTPSLAELTALPITQIKGQILEIKKPESMPALSLPLASKGYLVPGSFPETLCLGATFERTFSHAHPDLETAQKLLRPKFEALFPSYDTFEVLTCKAGIRASAPHHQPLSIRRSDNTWILTGMGSKGLLYHALYAKRLALEVVRTLKEAL